MNDERKMKRVSSLYCYIEIASIRINEQFGKQMVSCEEILTQSTANRFQEKIITQPLDIVRRS